jgi:hypothetical protein
MKFHKRTQGGEQVLAWKWRQPITRILSAVVNNQVMLEGEPALITSRKLMDRSKYTPRGVNAPVKA